MIDCTNMAGEWIQRPASEFQDRVGAYAIIERNGALLLELLPNGFYFMPGGALDPGEDLMTALRREVVEEVGGLHVNMFAPLGVFEHYYHYDPAGTSHHAISHVFVCTLDDGAEIPPFAGNPEEGYPEWVPLDGLTDQKLNPGCMARVIAAYREYRQGKP